MPSLGERLPWTQPCNYIVTQVGRDMVYIIGQSTRLSFPSCRLAIYRSARFFGGGYHIYVWLMGLMMLVPSTGSLVLFLLEESPGG
jgi:hypothetical protein